MADDARHTPPDLSALSRGSAHLDFFELLRSLETAERRFGRGGGPEREPARLGQGVRLTFATSDIASVTENDTAGVPQVNVNVIGLLGPEGPMPLHLTRWVMQRLSNRWFAGESERATSDTSFLDFCNTLQHRMMALYWRTWADNNPVVQIAYPGGGQVTAMLRALAGVGLPGTRDGPVARTSAKLRHATSLGQSVHGPERLTSYLSTVAGTPVRLTEFVGVWTDIPKRLQSRLGRNGARLGRTALLGARVFERHSRAELSLGPLSYAAFTAFLDDPEQAGELRHAVLFAAGRSLDVDVRLVLAGDDVPEPRLGTVRLGRTAWLRDAAGDEAEDLVLRRFSNRNDPGMEAAA